VTKDWLAYLGRGEYQVLMEEEELLVNREEMVFLDSLG